MSEECGFDSLRGYQMFCLTEPHNWKYSNGYRECKYCGRREANLRGPIEVAEIKPYHYGQSGKPAKTVFFVIGLLLLLFIVTVILFGIVVAVVCTFGG